MVRAKLKGAKRIIIKIGTSILTDKEGNIDKGYIKDIAKQISELSNKRKEILLVTSGAIGSGKNELGIRGRVRDIKLRQATAAVGQSLLMNDYHIAFKKYNKKVGQVLISYQSFFDRKTYLNLRGSIDTLLKLDVIPIINENDPLATDEINETFGDNDKLSALIASKIDADLLIMLTDTGGLCTKDPKNFKDARIIKTVENINKEIESCASKTSSVVSKGGMKTKIEAAKITMDAGCTLVIVNGKEKNVLGRVIKGESLGTIFLPKEKLESKKRWIRHAPAKGRIIVDKGAKNAILKGKNLLPAGVLDIKGKFNIQDIVEIVCDKKPFAKGIIDYSSEDLKRLKGKSSDQIKKLYDGCYINVFRHENLVLV